MYSGCLEILEDDDVVVAILSNGDAFGEEVWKQMNGRKFKKQKSRYYVRALAPTDLRLLKSESLSKVLQFYHQFGESFESKMRLRCETCNVIQIFIWALSFNLCAGMPKHSVMSHDDFEGRDGHNGNKCGDQLITTQTSGRLSSLPNIIDPVTRMETKRSRFSKKWATIDGSLGRREFDLLISIMS